MRLCLSDHLSRLTLWPACDPIKCLSDLAVTLEGDYLTRLWPCKVSPYLTWPDLWPCRGTTMTWSRAVHWQRTPPRLRSPTSPRRRSLCLLRRPTRALPPPPCRCRRPSSRPTLTTRSRCRPRPRRQRVQVWRAQSRPPTRQVSCRDGPAHGGQKYTALGGRSLAEVGRKFPAQQRACRDVYFSLVCFYMCYFYAFLRPTKAQSNIKWNICLICWKLNVIYCKATAECNSLRRRFGISGVIVIRVSFCIPQPWIPINARFWAGWMVTFYYTRRRWRQKSDVAS